MSEHTPGPWKADRAPNGRSLVTYENGTIVATVLPYTDDPMKDRASADARLIAAAPDLLEAANRMMDANPCGCDVCREMEAAIAKAEGEA